MIINSKAISLTEAAIKLGKSEQEVLRLSQYGYWSKANLRTARPE